jgi:hypothetical protein
MPRCVVAQQLLTAVPHNAVMCRAVLCCARPVPTEPKADPLGRNLNGAPQAELPPGFVDAEAEAAKAKQGKPAACVWALSMLGVAPSRAGLLSRDAPARACCLIPLCWTPLRLCQHTCMPSASGYPVYQLAGCDAGFPFTSLLFTPLLTLFCGLNPADSP